MPRARSAVQSARYSFAVGRGALNNAAVPELEQDGPSGIAESDTGFSMPGCGNFVWVDCRRKGKRLPLSDWQSRADPGAKIARMKNGTACLPGQVRQQFVRNFPSHWQGGFAVPFPIHELRGTWLVHRAWVD